jgi:hypothetical protein
MLIVAMTAVGCRVKTTQKLPAGEIRPLLQATREELIAKYNELGHAVRTLNAKVELQTHTGSRYTGVIENYSKLSGFILAVKPSHIRMIGQAPVVGSNVFDMVSDGETFRIFIPPKGKFIVGPAHFERPSKKPLENLRPQHVLDALFWPELEAIPTVLFQEENQGADRYYVLTVVHPGAIFEVERRIWVDRTDLSLARVEIFETGGRLVSDIRYTDWEGQGEERYPREILLDRPHDDYRIEIRVSHLTLNLEIADDRFHLEQPPGTQLVTVGDKDSEAGGGPQP